MSLSLNQESALNATLSGSTGTFRVGVDQELQTSHEVRYLLTHVGLDLEVSQNSLLKHLAPVREIFKSEDLEFAHIMQRDIDDSRVSHELIPYLLDEQATDLVKLFPPIIVVLLPSAASGTAPEPLYPLIDEGVTRDEHSEKHGLYTIRSGAVGEEVFQFEQPISNGKHLDHDLVRLRINTERSRMVIVDGQHRAMALLALYRNLKDDWSDAKRAPFKNFYSEWTSSRIRQFDVSGISLPVMICTVPSLDASYDGDYDLIKAAREIFLTLNKSAKRVSESRNRLLDDQDAIAEFLRQTLSKVKNRDVLSEGALSLSNVELEQSGNQLSSQSPIAITGVNHLYYLIEHLLLNKHEDVDGIKKRKGVFASRNDLDAYGTLSRLSGIDVIGESACQSIRRNRYSSESIQQLSNEFMKSFGQKTLELFDKFLPFKFHNESCIALKESLVAQGDARSISLLFGGQGTGRIFDDHKNRLNEKLNNGFYKTDVPRIKAISQELDGIASKLNREVEVMINERSFRFVSNISRGNELCDERTVFSGLNAEIKKLYREVFSTVAFQTALACGFFREVENLEIEKDQAFEEYLDNVNNFFAPATISKLKKLLQLFNRRVVGENVPEWQFYPSRDAFRQVVYRGEMQPDQWPSYRAILLEIWKPSNEDLKPRIESERAIVRQQIFDNLYRVKKVAYCRDNLVVEENLSKAQLKEIISESIGAFTEFLKLLDASDIPKKSTLQSQIEAVPNASADT